MTAKPASENSPKAAHVQEAVRKIEAFNTELLSERGTYMNRCQKIRAKQSDVYDIAKDQGIPKKELKAIIRERDLRRKAAEIRLDLEKDERATFDKLKGQLGALGNWAAAQAEKDKRVKRVQLAEPLKGVEQEQERDLRGNQQKQTERERAENGHGANGAGKDGDKLAERPDADALAKVGRGKGDEPLDELTRH